MFLLTFLQLVSERTYHLLRISTFFCLCISYSANQLLLCLCLHLIFNLGCTVCQCQLHHVDGLDHSEVRRSFLLKENEDEQVIKLVGNSGFTWGVVSNFALNICQ